ncbi:MAG: prolipoprotein diacylglyceryl transferase, partial [Gammaproteobacteria bacterium]
PNIDPAALRLGDFAVHWYGLMYLIGFAGAWWLGMLRARRAESGWRAEEISDLVFYAALGAILGGRIGYSLFYNFSYFLEEPLRLFYIWQGGMSFHGGMLGVFVALYLFGRKNGMGFFQVSDFIAPMVPIGLGMGRIGNFINKELWGRQVESALPWAMDYGDRIARHPSSLYQAFSEGLLLFLILWWYSARPRPRMAVSALFMLCYGSFRFITEFFRTPDAHLGFIAFEWLTMGQLLSIPMVIFGIVVYWLAIKSEPAR